MISAALYFQSVRIRIPHHIYLFADAFGFTSSSESSMTVNGPSLTSEIFM
jgi:hypothetical protein